MIKFYIDVILWYVSPNIATFVMLTSALFSMVIYNKDEVLLSVVYLHIINIVTLSRCSDKSLQLDRVRDSVELPP
jgi:hypothetical protein